MKFKSIMLAALAALTLASCSKDSNPGNPGGPDGPEVPAGEETYATFSITLAKANDSKAFHGSTTPTADERAVKNLTVYIYDYYTDAIEKVLTFTDETQTHTVLVTTGPKKFVATSGMTPAFVEGQTTGVDIDNTIINLRAGGANPEDYFTNNLIVPQEFWMTSNIVEHTVVSATREEAESTGHHNNITMKLGRAMAKIGVVYNEDIVITDATEVDDLGTMSSVEYRIKNQPDQMYLFTGYDASGVWITPYFNRNNNLWANNHAANYWPQTTWSSTAIDGSQNHVAPTYMMENSNMTARYGNATYASIKGIFSPEDNSWYDNLGGSVTGTWTAGTDFWRIGKIDPNTGDVIGFVDDKIYNAVPDASLYASDGTEGPVKYEGGVMYYWIYLNSTLGQAFPTNTADKYSQHRNQYWDVDITKVTGLGWHEEDGGRPDNPEPLDEQSYIHATIEILDWEEVNMNGDLEGNN